MQDSILSPEELRAAMVNELVSRQRDLGKIKLQKLVYFLQEAFGLPLGCRFYLHHYGAYSDEVETAISNLKFMGYVVVQPDPSGYGFHVTPAPASEGEPGWSSVAESARESVDALLDRFGSMDTSQLELASTIHFVKRKFGLKKSDVITSVRLRKPKFRKEAIAKTYDDLASMGMI